MLRAIGVTRNQVLSLFLGKSGLIGLLGGCAGLALGCVAANAIAQSTDSFVAPSLHWELLLTVPIAATISVLATWIPVEFVTGKDPAVILREAS